MSTSAKTSRLSPDLAERLAKLLGLLGSDHPGERAAAALKANELVKRQGLQWSDVIRTDADDDIDDDDDGDDGGDIGWRAMAMVCAPRASLLSDREKLFVRTLARYRTAPSEKQRDWLESIYNRIGGR